MSCRYYIERTFYPQGGKPGHIRPARGIGFLPIRARRSPRSPWQDPGNGAAAGAMRCVFRCRRAQDPEVRCAAQWRRPKRRNREAWWATGMSDDGNHPHASLEMHDRRTPRHGGLLRQTESLLSGSSPASCGMPPSERRRGRGKARPREAAPGAPGGKCSPRPAVHPRRCCRQA